MTDSHMRNQPKPPTTVSCCSHCCHRGLSAVSVRLGHMAIHLHGNTQHSTQGFSNKQKYIQSRTPATPSQTLTNAQRQHLHGCCITPSHPQLHNHAYCLASPAAAYYCTGHACAPTLLHNSNTQHLLLTCRAHTTPRTAAAAVLMLLLKQPAYQLHPKTPAANCTQLLLLLAAVNLGGVLPPIPLLLLSRYDFPAAATFAAAAVAGLHSRKSYVWLLVS